MSKNTNTKQIDSIRKIIKIFVASDCEIRPHFILTGPSGSGKSHLLNTLAQELQITMLEVNAAQLTREGLSGNSLSKSLSPLMNMGDKPVIVFVDEFDKLFISGNSNSNLAHESTNGVQNEFLKTLEGSIEVFGDYGHYHRIKTENCLFVFAGAFNGEENIDIDRLREFGIKTEFLGRVGLAYGLQKVSLDDMKDILEHSPLLEKYCALDTKPNKKNIVKEIMEVVEQNYEKNTLGVRLINTLIHQYFIEGSLNKPAAKKLAFQTKLSLTS